MIESHFCAATDAVTACRLQWRRPLKVAARDSLSPSAPAPALRAQAPSETEESSEKGGHRPSRPAPVQAREMGGPKAGLIARPRDHSAEPVQLTAGPAVT